MSRVLAVVGLVIAISLLPAEMVGQSPTPVSATKDPQAITTLSQCLTAEGGLSAVNAVQDYTATGNITYFWAGNPVQGTVTLRGMGTGAFRLDAVLPQGNRSWAVDAGQGFLQDFNGNTTPFLFNDAVNLGGFSFPFLAIANSLSDATISVTNLGQAEVNARSVSRIQLQKILPSAVDPTGKTSSAMVQVLSIDSSTYQLVDLQYTMSANDHSTNTIPHDVQFSGYQQVNGVSVPFTIAEQVSGQQTMTIQLASITFNTGLTDAVFQQ